MIFQYESALASKKKKKTSKMQKVSKNLKSPEPCTPNNK